MLKRILTVLILFIASLLAHATVVEGLYEGQVTVENQSIRTQQLAMQEALKQVLVKVSGSTTILRHDGIRQALADSQSMVHAYRFDNRNGQLYFHAEFDPQRVNNVILEAKFPIWGARRPDSILWFAVEDPDTMKRQVLSENSFHPVIDVAKQIAQRRGIPVSLPLYDLTDIQYVSIYDIWGQFADALQVASNRYNADFIVSARMFYRDPQKLAEADDTAEVSGWIADYLMIDGEQIESRRISADSPTALADMIMTILADTLAGKYAINYIGEGQTTTVDLTITNLTSLKAYVEVNQFLASLSMVTDVTLTEQSGYSGVFSLRLLGSERDLVNAFKLDDKIRPVLDEFGQAKQNLQYIWVP